MLLADVIPPDVTSGWVSVALQGGAFGLLVYIVTVSWPKAAQDAREEREARDKNFQAVVELLQGKFEDRNRAVVAALQDQTRSLREEFRTQTGTIEKALAVVCQARGK